MLGWVGLAVAIIGTLIAVIQSIRAEQFAKSLKRQKRAQVAQIWHQISLVLNAYETLEDAREFARSNSNPDALLAKIASARRCVVDQYLDLLRSAVLEETTFDEAKLQKWIEQGRLENEWRITHARKLIHE